MNLTTPKLLTLDEAVTKRQQLRVSGQKLVLTNGCFDLLHVGHLSYLQHSRELGDQLWVLINSDQSVRSLKGSDRPIQSEIERAFSLAALACVDRVIIFHTTRLVSEIHALRPDIYTKAGDYTMDTINADERAAFEAVHTEIRFLPFLEGFSSTKMIQKIKKWGSV